MEIRKLILGTICAITVTLSSIAFADTTWMFQNTTFIDGGTLTGTFTTDVSGNLVSYNVTSSADSSISLFTGFNYSKSDSTGSVYNYGAPVSVGSAIYFGTFLNGVNIAFNLFGLNSPPLAA